MGKHLYLFYRGQAEVIKLGKTNDLADSGSHMWRELSHAVREEFPFKINDSFRRRGTVGTRWWPRIILISATAMAILPLGTVDQSAVGRGSRENVKSGARVHLEVGGLC